MERLADGIARSCQQPELGGSERADPAWASNYRKTIKKPDHLTSNGFSECGAWLNLYLILILYIRRNHYRASLLLFVDTKKLPSPPVRGDLSVHLDLAAVMPAG